MGKLDGRVALVTGSGAGMGRAHALTLAAEGADLIVHDVDGESAERTGADVEALGRRVHVIRCDVSDVPAMREAVTAAEAAMERIDILVNNAGFNRAPGAFEAITEAEYDRMFAVHVKGHFFVTQAVVPGMRRRRYGKIINVSSIWGMVGHSEFSHYAGTKGALLALTKSWAKEFAPDNVMVNAIAPGWVVTDLVLARGGTALVEEVAKSIPLKRAADAAEISFTVRFLASPDSDYITGQVISPNGGDTIVGI